jgi:hypothetical protein
MGNIRSRIAGRRLAELRGDEKQLPRRQREVHAFCNVATSYLLEQLHERLITREEFFERQTSVSFYASTFDRVYSVVKSLQKSMSTFIADLQKISSLRGSELPSRLSTWLEGRDSELQALSEALVLRFDAIRTFLFVLQTTHQAHADMLLALSALHSVLHECALKCPGLDNPASIVEQLNLATLASDSCLSLISS